MRSGINFGIGTGALLCLREGFENMLLDAFRCILSDAVGSIELMRSVCERQGG